MFSVKDMAGLCKEMAEIEVAKTPNYRAMLIFAKELKKVGLGQEVAADIKIELTEAFFDDEKLAQECIESYVQVISNLNEQLLLDFPFDTADLIFVKLVQGMTFKYG